jgi:ribosome-associated translation inhibitor RaiA
MLKSNDRLLNKLERKIKRINTKRNQGNQDKWTLAKLYDVSFLFIFKLGIL